MKEELLKCLICGSLWKFLGEMDRLTDETDDVEKGFTVCLDRKGRLHAVEAAGGTSSRVELRTCPSGDVMVATFHTHPYDPEGSAEPSVADFYGALEEEAPGMCVGQPVSEKGFISNQVRCYMFNKAHPEYGEFRERFLREAKLARLLTESLAILASAGYADEVKKGIELYAGEKRKAEALLEEAKRKGIIVECPITRSESDRSYFRHVGDKYIALLFRRAKGGGKR